MAEPAAPTRVDPTHAALTQGPSPPPHIYTHKGAVSRGAPYSIRLWEAADSRLVIAAVEVWTASGADLYTDDQNAGHSRVILKLPWSSVRPVRWYNQGRAETGRESLGIDMF